MLSPPLSHARVGEHPDSVRIYSSLAHVASVTQNINDEHSHMHANTRPHACIVVALVDVHTANLAFDTYERVDAQTPSPAPLE